MEIIILLIILLFSGAFERIVKFFKELEGHTNTPNGAGKQEYRSIFEKYLTQGEEENNPWQQGRRIIRAVPEEAVSRKAQRTENTRKASANAKAKNNIKRHSEESSIYSKEMKRKLEESDSTSVHNADVPETAESGELLQPSVVGSMDIRAAIIWSEILQKPKALRRKQ